MPVPWTWKMVMATIGSVASAVGIILWALLGVVYGGLKDDIKNTITKAPTLEKTISETHDAIIKLQDSVDLLNPREMHDIMIALKPVPQQLQEIKTQLDSMQYQIHHPGKS